MTTPRGLVCDPLPVVIEIDEDDTKPPPVNIEKQPPSVNKPPSVSKPPSVNKPPASQLQATAMKETASSTALAKPSSSALKRPSGGGFIVPRPQKKKKICLFSIAVRDVTHAPKRS